MTTLLEALQALKDNGLADDTLKDVCNELLENDDLEDNDDVKPLVIIYDRLDNGNGFTTDIDQCSYDDCTFEVDGETWLVCDEDEKESKWDEALDHYLDECVEGGNGPYFDRDAWKRDARMDGDGHCLSSYDGNVNECAAGPGWHFLYRQN